MQVAEYQHHNAATVSRTDALHLYPRMFGTPAGQRFSISALRAALVTIRRNPEKQYEGWNEHATPGHIILADWLSGLHYRINNRTVKTSDSTPLWRDGYPVNLQAAALDALEWLNVMADQKGAIEFNAENRNRLRQCRTILADKLSPNA